MKLKELRKEKHLTQEQIAKIINVSQVGYNNYETERREIPLNSLICLANYYNVTLDYLVGRDFKNDIGYLNQDQKNVVYVIKQLNKKNLDFILGQSLRLLNEQ